MPMPAVVTDQPRFFIFSMALSSLGPRPVLGFASFIFKFRAKGG